MKKQSKKALALSKETVRAMGATELTAVAGAYSGDAYSCHTCGVCGGTGGTVACPGTGHTTI